MEFNDLILHELGDYIKRHSFQVTEQYKGHIKLESRHLVITITRSEYEQSNDLYIGEKDGKQYAVYNELTQSLFQQDLKTGYYDPSIFAASLSSLLDNVDFFDKTVLKLIAQYSEDWYREYLAKVYLEQDMKRVDKAWEESDYNAFLEHIAKIDSDKLLPSYKQKIKIATRNINNALPEQ